VLVGIGLLTLVPRRIGGSETYARELLRGLSRVGRLDYSVFLPRIAADAAGGLPSRIVVSYPAGTSTARRAAAMVATTLLPGRVRREVELAAVDAVHFPLTSAVPLLDVPTVVTVHDLYHELFPAALPRGEVLWRRATWRRTLRRARIVIAVSETVKRSLVERYGIEHDRIRVVLHGVDHDRFHPGIEPRQPFLLYPAHRWPNKNHDRLLAAFAIVRRRRPELRLVLTGNGHPDGIAPAGVEVRGYVCDEELVSLYRTAAALVFPSLYEGFGQPPLEAMACGCPVAAAATGAVPEVCGDAARLFDPWSIDDIAAAIEDVLGGRDEWTARGLERAARFSWERCAREHEDVYRELTE
jgi:glycosyltransferase involved in cell wall biosynthesis